MQIISLRNYVKKELKKQKKFNSKEEEYMFYLHLLIKDETNINLLKLYLLFLKTNIDYLEKKQIPHENFLDELNYYSIFFEKDELNKLFKNYNFIPEKTKLINLLNDYTKNIKNNSFQKFKEIIKNKNIIRLFNQPVSYNIKELLYINSIKLYLMIFLKKKIKKKKIYQINHILQVKYQKKM